MSASYCLTRRFFYDIVDGRMEEHRSFFYAQNSFSAEKEIRNTQQRNLKWRWKSCAQELHWHVQNANSVITT